MRIVYFTHSLASCWNHGNAHFLRGVLRALGQRGHDVLAIEPENSWSRQNLLADHGNAGLDAFREAYPDLAWRMFVNMEDVEAAVSDADLVIVHEWNDPALVAYLGQMRRHAPFTLLFHDTHHRAVSDPDAIRRFDLNVYDGVLAFGATVAEAYRRWGWGDRVFVWHEAADTSVFHPQAAEVERLGLIWIGNWGDDERSAALEAFLLQPAQRAGLRLDIHGVRYPPHAVQALDRYGARFHGWVPNARAPQVFGRHLATVHVPRRFYVDALPGVPTIRVFEALACGIPLLSAPWQDAEGLFRVGKDFLQAQTSTEMEHFMRSIQNDPALRRSLTQSGLETIQTRHSCGHRADELLAIAAMLQGVTA